MPGFFVLNEIVSFVHQLYTAEHAPLETKGNSEGKSESERVRRGSASRTSDDSSHPSTRIDYTGGSQHRSMPLGICYIIVRLPVFWKFTW
jgi:hypothetical protein